MKLYLAIFLLAAFLIKPFSIQSQSFEIVDPGPQPAYTYFNFQLINAKDTANDLRNGSFFVEISTVTQSPLYRTLFYGNATFVDGETTVLIRLPNQNGTYNTQVIVDENETEYILLTTDLSSFTLQDPGTQIAGTPFDLSITAAKDYYNVDLTGSHLVTVTTDNTSEGNGGLLFSGNVTYTAGEATVSDPGIVLYLAETQILTVSVEGVTGSKTGGVTVNPALASKLVITTQPANVTGNYDDNPVLLSTIVLVSEDAYGNLSSSGLVSPQNIVVSIDNNPGGASLGGTTSVDIQSGTASFNAFSINQDGIGYTLLFASTTPISLTSATSNPFNVTQLNNLSGFTISSPAPASTQYQNVDFQIQLSNAVDNFGAEYSGEYNVIISSSSEGTVFNNDLSFTNGAASLTIALGNLGGHTLTVSIEGIDTDENLALTVNEDLSDFTVVNPGSPQYRDIPFQVGITGAKDWDGNDLSGNVIVTITSSIDDTVFNEAATFISGASSPTVSLGTLGTHNLFVNIARITEEVVISDIVVLENSTDFTIAGTSTSAQTAGVNSTINIIDANSVTGDLNGLYNVSVSSDVAGEGIAGIVFDEAVSFSNGDGTFDVNLKIAANHTLTISIDSITPVKTHQIAVSAADVSQMIITQQPAGGNGLNNDVPVGIGTVIVRTQDAFGNFSVSGLGGTPELTASILNDASAGDTATLGGTLTQSISSGTATFSNLTLDLDGNGYTLSFIYNGTPVISSISTDPFNITNVENQSGFEIIPPGPQVINIPFDLQLINATDSLGNLLQELRTVVVVRTQPTVGIVFNSAVQFSNGETQIPLTITSAGSYSFYVSLEENVEENFTTVVSENASGFDLTLTSPGDQTAGTPFDLNITNATDATATPLTGNRLVTITSDNTNEGINGLLFNGNLTFTSGSATRSITLNKVDNQEIIVSIDWVIYPDTINVNVIPAAATQFLITQQPVSQNGVNDNTPLNVGTVILQIQDDFGNISVDGLAGSQTVNVIITGSPAGVTLGGTTTGVDISSGTANFSDLTLDKNGDYSLSFTYNGSAPVFNPNPVVSSTISMTNVEDLSIFDIVPEAGTKYENIPFDLLISNALDTTGAPLNGSINVSITSSIDGSVYNSEIMFTGGSSSLSISLTIGTHNLISNVTGITNSDTITGLEVVADQSDFTLALDPTGGPFYNNNPFILEISGAKDLDGVNLSGDINVIITSNQPDGEVYNATANFINGEANIQLILMDVSNHTLTVLISGITDSKTIDVNVQDNVSDFTAALAVAGDKTAGVPFDIDVTSATSLSGTSLTGDYLVTVTGNVFGEEDVFNQNVSFTSGSASFSIILETATIHNLTVSIDSITPTKSVEVQIIPAAVSKLVITQHPTGGSGTQNDNPALIGTVIVGTFDEFDNPSVLGLSGTQELTASILNDSSYNVNAILGGTATQSISTGTATFNDLSLDQDGNGYTLLFTYSGDPVLSAVSSNSFNMVNINAYLISLKDTLDNPLDNINPYTFDTVIFGYSPVTAENITISREGNGVIQNLSVGLSGVNASDFTVTQPVLTILDVINPSTIFTLKPNDNLAAGNYSAVVTVTADNDVIKSFNVSVIVLAPYAISLDAEDPTVFSSVTEGYSQINDVIVTITNTGGLTITGLNIELSGTNPTDFVAGIPSPTTINPGLTSSFTIRPVNDLTPGTYTAKVIVNNDFSAPDSFNVSFEVIAYTYSVSLNPSGNINLGLASEGYTSAPEEIISITRTGTGTITNLAVELSGGVTSDFNISQPVLTTLDGNPDNSTTFNVSPKTGLSSGTYNDTITVSATNMTDVSFVVSFTVVDILVWTGNISTAWNTIGNWNPQMVPDQNVYIEIPATANQPVISSVNVTVNNLLIENGAELTVTSSRRLTIISGGLLTINPGGKLTVAGTFINNAGSSGLLVKSDATGTGSVIHNSTGVLAGFERYITGNKWHIASSPVTGQGIQNFISASSISSNSGNYAITHYSEGANKWQSYYTSSTSGVLAIGNGYLLRRDNDGVLSYTGELSVGNKNISIPKTDSGWNSVGNPFPSALGVTINASTSSNFLTANSSILDPSYAGLYVWDEPAVRESGVSYYKIINNSGGAGRFISPGYIQPGQGFLLKAIDNSNRSVSFTTSMRAHPIEATFYKKSSDASWQTINLTARTTTKEASTIIKFNEQMTRGLDITYDAGILGGDPALKLFTRLVDDNGVKFAIQCLPDNEEMVIPVGISLALAGTVTFSAEIPSLPIGYKAVLEDRQLGVFTNLEAEATYATGLSSGTGTGRFFLHVVLSTTDIKSTDKQKIAIFAYGKEIFIQGFVNDNSMAYIYDLTGKMLKAAHLEPDPANMNSFRVDELKTGIYIVRVLGKSGVQTERVYIE